MELQRLTSLGLTDGEINVYSALLEQGPLSAAAIIKATGLKKGDCYNKLYDLVDKGLIEEYDQSKKKHFRLLDPRRLDELTTTRYQSALQAKQEIESILPTLLSTYTLSHQRPGIVLFEGEEALRRTLEDSLKTKQPMLQITDSEAFDEYLPKEDAKYVRQRLAQKLHKQMLIPDTPKNRQYIASRGSAYNQYTEIRLLPGQQPAFKTSMLIYENKISYQTLKPETMIGVIIEDPLISLMHRSLFAVMWQQATVLKRSSVVQSRQ